MSHFDLKVWVAVNRDGLHLISKEKPELLLSIDYNDLCWAIGCPQDSSDPNCIPCLFIQIPEENDKNNTILQIFSRQYKLIEQILNSFIDDAKKSLSVDHVSCDVVDGGGPLSAESVSTPFSFGSNSKTLNRKKLSLATFDNSGQCINKTGSWVRSQHRRTIN
ncbi:unnamed protein product [Oppiella nova]|uniref:KRIT1/FRMD8 FERM domain-containing protein n=1 Tax=Oppiella nova TaxID=334625 RepID=A0A7R9MQ36_9ACAR|nr:unnamed protein product [Oppiella nova]CAG2180685.1 unnamed protein product [Oppiella nova]